MEFSQKLRERGAEDPHPVEWIYREAVEAVITVAHILADCVASNRSLTDLSLDECLDHFMECRKLDMEFVSANPIADSIAELRETVNRLEPTHLESEKYGKPLERWIAAVS